MIALDAETKAQAIAEKKVVFRFDIDRQYAVKNGGRFQNTGVITLEMYDEFFELLVRWNKENKY
ncbi:MAG TPA: hypothetical protein VNI84_19615 [Pyrinomonadaceae bacterium]|nr:hypothetical protein [Pyrinomonadaceae bacterium]